MGMRTKRGAIVSLRLILARIMVQAHPTDGLTRCGFALIIALDGVGSRTAASG